MTEAVGLPNSPLARQLAETGRVTITFSRRNVMTILAIAGALVAILFLVGFFTHNIHGIELFFGIVVVPLVLLAIGMVLTRAYHGKDLATTTRSANIYRLARSAPPC